MRRPLVVATEALVTAALLVGCGVHVLDPEPDSQPTIATRAQLIAQREAAGIPDCSATGRAVARPEGLPDLTLPCLGSNQTITLSALRGRPMVVNVWGTWCGPCREETPALRQFAKQASGKVRVIGIDVEDPDETTSIEFVHDAGLFYEHLYDTNAAVKGPLAMPGVPLTLLVNADGVIVHRVSGAIGSSDDLVRLVEQYLGVSV